MKGRVASAKKSPKFHFDNLFWDSPQPYEEIVLYQIGDICCNSGYEIGNHRQLCYEISYIVSGRGRYFTNNRGYELEKGDIYLCLPGEMHNGIADTVDPYRYFYVGFDFIDRPPRLSFLRQIQSTFDNINCPMTKDAQGLDTFFIGIFDELINNKEYSSYMVKTYLKQIIISTYRNFSGQYGDKYNPEKEAGCISYQVVNYIDMNLFEMGDLSRLGEELGYSYSYISQKFSQETGSTIQEYFNRQRFEQALIMLREEELTVTEIAEKLNYKSVHSFSKAFKNMFEVSPMQYQELYRERLEEGN